MTSRQRLFGLAVAFAHGQRHTVADDAVELAVDLLLAGDEQPDVVAVAALSPGTSRFDAAPLIVDLLAAYGIEVSAWPSSGETLTLAKYAFAHEGLPFADFDAVVYASEDAWDELDLLDKELTWLLMWWGEVSDAAERSGMEERMRQILRDLT